MSAFNKLEQWHQTKTGLLIFGLIELALAYVFASWAIAGGSLVDYFLAIVLFVGFAQNFVKLVIKVVRHG